MAGPTPRELGYRMPAEWEPHAGTWMSWPHRHSVSFRDRYDEVLPAFAAMVHTLAAHETVHLNVGDVGMEEEVRALLTRTGAGPHLDRVRYHRIPTDQPWCRDHGPIFVKRDEPGGGTSLAVVDWEYNAWGRKYPEIEQDNAVPRRVAEALGLPVFQPSIVLEGGSIEINGAGTLLTTEACLLNRNRNPHLSRTQLEQCLKDYLGIRQVLWLREGIVGDDTDGHVDDLTRFVDGRTVVTAVEEDPHDANYPMLRENRDRLRSMRNERGEPLQVIELPMPGVVEYRGQRLPASYANYYVANGVVLLPVYNHPHDRPAREILQQLFPTRRVVPLDSTVVVYGLGSFHCLTQQQPATG